MKCLWCHVTIIPEISWTNLILLSKQKQMCDICIKELVLLQGTRCKKCSRISNKDVCFDCKSWEQHKKWKHVLHSNYSVYAYNERMREIVAKWKYRGDYILSNIFKENFIRIFKEHFSFLKEDVLLAPIPLSEQRMQERAFNQADVLASFLPVNQQINLKRIHSEKQAKKTRDERMSIKNPFILTKKVNKPVILVDDIYTTGSTLRHAALLLKENGCPVVYAYTLIRG